MQSSGVRQLAAHAGCAVPSRVAEAPLGAGPRFSKWLNDSITKSLNDPMNQ
jgi:hypothetical protein